MSGERLTASLSVRSAVVAVDALRERAESCQRRAREARTANMRELWQRRAAEARAALAEMPGGDL